MTRRKASRVTVTRPNPESAPTQMAARKCKSLAKQYHPRSIAVVKSLIASYAPCPAAVQIPKRAPSPQSATMFRIAQGQDMADGGCAQRRKPAISLRSQGDSAADPRSLERRRLVQSVQLKRHQAKKNALKKKLSSPQSPVSCLLRGQPMSSCSQNSGD